MKISRSVLITHILKHKSAFNALLDYMTVRGVGGEIPQGLYLQQYREVICAEGDDADRRHLTLDVLHENGLFVHLDKQADTLTMQSFLVEMLRFIDTSRIRELSHRDFENIRGQFDEICATFEKELAINPGEDDYEEAKVTLFELVDNTLSKVQQNIEALEAKADSISNRYDELDQQGHSTVDTRRLLEDSESLYERFIKPCHEFLSPSIGMKEDRKTFTAAMERLADLHDRRGHQEVGLRLQYKLTAIRSYYKNIAQIDKRVQRYHRSQAAERIRYRAIEQSYNQLREAVVELRHGKLRGTKLPADSPVFAGTDYLQGLKVHSASYEPRLDWYDVNNRLRLDEWWESVRESETDTVESVPVPLPVVEDVEQKRREEVAQLCIERQWPTAVDDIVRDIAHWLPAVVEQCSLLDLLTAYQCCLGMRSLRDRMVYHRTRRRIELGTRYFEYLQIQLAPVSIEEHELSYE